MIKKYILDAIESQMNNKEADEYYKYSIEYLLKNNHNKLDMYLDNEKKYIKFFIKLFNENKKQCYIKIDKIGSLFLKSFEKDEKKEIIEMFNKINIEDFLTDEYLLFENEKDLSNVIKLTFREGLEYIFNFSYLDIKIEGIGDYLYLLYVEEKYDEIIKTKCKESKLYLKH